MAPPPNTDPDRFRRVPNVDPPWGGQERSIRNLLFLLFQLFIAIPVLIGGLLFNLICFLYTGHIMYWEETYATGFAFASIPYLSWMFYLKRVWINVPSNEVTLITDDLRSSAERARREGNEEIANEGFKLENGFYFLSPFDQVFTTIKIEGDEHILDIENLRVSLGEEKTDENKKRDMLVSGTASFQTDSNNLLRFARVAPLDSTDSRYHDHPVKRSSKIIAHLQKLIEGIIETECRQCKSPEELLDKKEKIEIAIWDKIQDHVKGQYLGVFLTKFHIGNIDYPAKVAAARDTEGEMETLRQAANKVVEESKTGISYKEAYDLVLIAHERITKTLEEKKYGFEEPTLQTLMTAVRLLNDSLRRDRTPPENE